MTADRQTQLAPNLAGELAAAIEWWRQAGIDHAFRDEASGWLADPAVDHAPAAVAPMQAATEPAAPPTPRLGGDATTWPTDLSAFRQWWLAEPGLSHEGTFPRIAPRGAAGADVLLLVAQPEEDDRETLLSGPAGKLLGAMLLAMGVAQERAYFAAALPRHTPLPDWEGLTASGLREVVAHHIALVAPSRIIAFGRLTSALVSHDTAQDAAPLRYFNHGGVKVPVLDADDLDSLRRRPNARATFWRRWLKFTDGTG